MLRSLGDYISAFPVARAVAVALAYFFAAELGHLLSPKAHDPAIATLWPPAGLLLATLVLTRYRHWPLMLLAACTANLASDVLLHDKSVWVSLGFCAANCGEASIGAWLLRCVVGLPFTMERIKDVLGLACLSALISTIFGATVGAGVVKLAFGGSYGLAWQTWWCADSAGILLFAPIVFTWTANRVTSSSGLYRWRTMESALLFLGVSLVTAGIYGELLPRSLTVPIFILPFLLWAAFRFGPSGAATALLVVAVIGVWNTSLGRGPYTNLALSPIEQIVRAQLALSVIILCVLTLAATVAERKQAEQIRLKLIGELEQALTEIKTLRGLIPICAWCKKIRDDVGSWQRLEDYLRAHTDAMFSHGVCPDCFQYQLATMTREGPDDEES